MGSYSCEDSLRGACYSNEVSRAALMGGQPPNRAWFVDSVDGSDKNSGKGRSTKAFATINKLDDVLEAYDWVYMRGSFNEAYTCSLAGVRFIGDGHAQKECVWTAPTVAGSWCLKMAANYQRVENIYFKPVIYVTSGTPAGILLSGANHAQILGNRFQGLTGSYAAIYSPVCDSDNVIVADNLFMYMNTATYGAGILGVEAGGLSYSGWQILRNYFNSCVTDININGRACLLMGNVHPIGGISAASAVAAVTTMAIDLSGTSSGGNTVTGCSLAGAYTSSLYVGGAAQDNWAGNYAAITTTYCPNGITVPTKPA